MIAWNEIAEVGRDIGLVAHAERVILFGSHARGEAGVDSDLDILVVAESDQPRHKRSRELYRRVRPRHVALDILVFTPAEVARAMKTDVSFISQAMNEGKTLYVRGNPAGQSGDSDALFGGHTLSRRRYRSAESCGCQGSQAMRGSCLQLVGG